MTKIIVIFIAKYLRDYKNSHIFVLKGAERQKIARWAILAKAPDCRAGKLIKIASPDCVGIAMTV